LPSSNIIHKRADTIGIYKPICIPIKASHATYALDRYGARLYILDPIIIARIKEKIIEIAKNNLLKKNQRSKGIS